MLIAKVLRITGDSVMQIEATTALLQDFIDQTTPADLHKLLVKAKEKPSVIKTALKFV